MLQTIHGSSHLSNNLGLRYVRLLHPLSQIAFRIKVRRSQFHFKIGLKTSKHHNIGKPIAIERQRLRKIRIDQMLASHHCNSLIVVDQSIHEPIGLCCDEVQSAFEPLPLFDICHLPVQFAFQKSGSDVQKLDSSFRQYLVA
jgi:hypothetical protein